MNKLEAKLLKVLEQVLWGLELRLEREPDHVGLILDVEAVKKVIKEAKGEI